jgi:phage tail sheath protein FI
VPSVAPAATDRFTVQVFDSRYSTSDALEEWECTLKDAVDDTGQQMEITQRINAFSELLEVTSNVPNLLSAPPAIKATARTPLLGGTSGSAVTNSQIAAAWSTYFGDAEKVKVQLLINGGYTDVTVQQQMVQIAQKRGDAVALLDIPSASQSADNAVKYRTLIAGIDSSYCAWYTADNFQSDLYNGKKLYTPPSGWAAAVCARTDRIVGAQGAPAGMNRALLPILGTRHEYDDAERTYLFENKINYTRKIIGSGNFIWEQVTGQSKNSALSWLNVRRMINVIKTSVKDFLMFSLQEPNDDFTRKQIVTACTEYLQAWKDARGIVDFKVVVDDSNNTPAFFNRGILKVAFFITPMIPIHEIQVDVVITKKGVSFSEINIQNLA